MLSSPRLVDSEVNVSDSHSNSDYFSHFSNETRLSEKLFSWRHDTRARPIKNFSESIRVNWTTHLLEILEVNIFLLKEDSETISFYF